MGFLSLSRESNGFNEQNLSLSGGEKNKPMESGRILSKAGEVGRKEKEEDQPALSGDCFDCISPSKRMSAGGQG